MVWYFPGPATWPGGPYRQHLHEVGDLCAHDPGVLSGLAVLRAGPTFPVHTDAVHLLHLEHSLGKAKPGIPSIKHLF